jgi:putative transposon-encoded protein
MYKQVYTIIVEELKLTDRKLVLTADIEDIIRRKATPIGNGAHVTCPKEYLGRTVYLIVCKE